MKTEILIRSNRQFNSMNLIWPTYYNAVRTMTDIDMNWFCTLRRATTTRLDSHRYNYEFGQPRPCTGFSKHEFAIRMYSNSSRHITSLYSTHGQQLRQAMRKVSSEDRQW